MRIEIVEDMVVARELWQGRSPSERLVDQFDYKLATLSPSFTDVHMMVARQGNSIEGLLPLCRFNGKLEVLGQFWAEKYRLAISGVAWEAMKEQLVRPVSMLYYSVEYCGMVKMEAERAVLSLPVQFAVSDYISRFNDSDARRDIRQALAWKDLASYTISEKFCDQDIEHLVLFSRSRLGDRSRFLEGDHARSFVGVCQYLQSVGALRVARYCLGDETVGVSFLSYDKYEHSLTHLIGFFNGELKNFGKHMYLTYVEVAEMLRCKTVIAMSPMYRIKSDMQYVGEPLYSYERA
jgi:hypothetical protein